MKGTKVNKNKLRYTIQQYRSNNNILPLNYFCFLFFVIKHKYPKKLKLAGALINERHQSKGKQIERHRMIMIFSVERALNLQSYCIFVVHPR